MSDSPIGVLDSGVGGLSILRELRAQLPAENAIYVADQGRVPYGPRPIDEVRAFTVELVRLPDAPVCCGRLFRVSGQVSGSPGHRHTGAHPLEFHAGLIVKAWGPNPVGTMMA